MFVVLIELRSSAAMSQVWAARREETIQNVTIFIFQYYRSLYRDWVKIDAEETVMFLSDSSDGDGCEVMVAS